MNRFHLVHTTEFIYEGPVSESYNEVRLRPMHDERQSCVSFRLMTSPASRGTAYRDAYGNWAHQFNVLAEHARLKVEAESVVLVHDVPPSLPDDSPLAPFDINHEAFDEEYIDFMSPTGYVPLLDALAPLVELAEINSGGTVAGFVTAASEGIYKNFRYVKGATHVHSSIEDSLSLGAGVCQDFSHLMLGVVRKRGLPARYVSGYLVPGSADGGADKQEEVIGGQASHAWVEVFLPKSGWTGFDPTLGKLAGMRHVRVAYGRDYGDVAPVRGVYKGHAGQRLSVDVTVRPALDTEGCEQLVETSLAPESRPAFLERAQQPPLRADQQQQQ